MKKIIITSVWLILIGSQMFSQSIPADNLYLGHTPPGVNQQRFNLGITK